MAKPIPVFLGSVDGEGKLWLEARGLFDRYLKSALKNKPVQVVVKVLARRKSQSQLGYWHGVIIPIIAEEFGYAEWEHDAVHDAVMRHLRGLKPEPNPLQARVSMREMTHDEVSALIEDARHWMLTEHGCVIPDATKVEGKRTAA